MKTNKLPLVSVIMPIFNGSIYMAQAIDSILNQTYSNFELIVVNDNSTDNTLEILNSYKKRYPKIKIINLNSQHGPFAAANLAIKQAKGEYIAPMDSDDISNPKRLEKQVAYFLKNKNTIVVGTYARIIDGEGKIIGKKTFATTHDKIYNQFFEVHPIVHPSAMINRRLLPNKNRVYYEKYGINGDYFTSFNLLSYGKFANLPEFLFNYRIHLKNSSLQKPKEKFFNSVKIRIYALTKLGYKPNLNGFFKFALQLIVVPFIPEAYLLTIYLISKGFYTPKEINISFLKHKHVSQSTAKNISPASLPSA